MFYSATETWWIPMLLVLGASRHIIRRFPLGYDTLYWGCSRCACTGVATREMLRARDLPFLGALPKTMFAAALTA